MFPHGLSKIESPTYRWEKRKDSDFLHLQAGPHIVAVLVIVRPIIREHEIRVHTVVGVVHAEIPYALSPSPLIMEAATYVEPVTRRDTEIVSMVNVLRVSNIAIWSHYRDLAYRHRGRPAGGE